MWLLPENGRWQPHFFALFLAALKKKVLNLIFKTYSIND